MNKAKRHQRKRIQKEIIHFACMCKFSGVVGDDEYYACESAINYLLTSPKIDKHLRKKFAKRHAVVWQQRQYTINASD